MASKEHPLLMQAAKQFPDLTDAEKKFLHAVIAGEVADYSSPNDAEKDPRHAENWSASRTLRATIIRWLCVDRMSTRQVDPKGIQIKAAKIEGRLDLTYATVSVPLDFDGCAVPNGVKLVYANTRTLWFERSFIGPYDGIALHADAVQVNGGVFLRYGFYAEGEVRLVGATITGNLDCSGGTFYNPTGTALNADSTTIGGAALLRSGHPPNGLICFFKAEGLIRFVSSKIGGYMDFRRAQLMGQAPYNGLIAENIEVTGTLDWRGIKGTDETVLSFWSAKIGVLADEKDSWPARDKLDLEDFTYAAISAGPMDAKTRLKWLKCQTSNRLDPLEDYYGFSSPRPRVFSPQPYQQLAKVLREIGHEADAKKVLIGKERARRSRGRLGWGAYAWNLLQDITIGYGYRPLRPVGVAVAIILVGWLLFSVGYRTGIVIPAKEEAYKVYENTGEPPRSYPRFNSGMYALDTFLPIVNLGQKDYWWPDATCRPQHIVQGPPPPIRPLGISILDNLLERGADLSWSIATGCRLHQYRWVLVAAGWLWTTLAVAWFTGLVRKE